MPVRLVVTDGTTSDSSQVGELIEGIEAEYLLADRGYDTNDVIEQIIEAKNNRGQNGSSNPAEEKSERETRIQKGYIRETP